MNFAFDDLARAVAGKESLNDCKAYELKQLVTRYPYFGPAHLLLAKKLKEEKLTADQHYQKALLHFQEPAWLDQLLSKVEELQQTTATTVVDTAPIQAEQEVPTTYEEVVVQKTHNFDIVISEEKMARANEAAPLIEPKIAPLKMNFEEVSATTELSFEPYHTVDYFASQGIRVKDEEKPKDRFSQQLKSFTEWLKEMRRVPATDVASSVNPNEEKKVEQMAEKSITNREVVTEAMAEVWEKQGNHEKALDTYKKLSLLDPAKSSYFAAKIEQLKHS